MSINRITRERLYQDETVFNKLLPFAKYDEEQQVFIHSDASIWSLWELEPLIITKTSDSDAFQMCSQIQEMLDSLDHTISAQFCWITTFEVERLLKDCIAKYPKSGPAGWMAQRWVRMLKNEAASQVYHRRPRRLRLVCGFRYDPPWRAQGFIAQLRRQAELLLSGKVGTGAQIRKREYEGYANKFRGVIEGNVQKMADIGFRPKRIDGQGLS